MRYTIRSVEPKLLRCIWLEKEHSFDDFTSFCIYGVIAAYAEKENPPQSGNGGH